MFVSLPTVDCASAVEMLFDRGSDWQSGRVTTGLFAACWQYHTWSAPAGVIQNMLVKLPVDA
jgi:hypothetical protein